MREKKGRKIQKSNKERPNGEAMMDKKGEEKERTKKSINTETKNGSPNKERKREQKFRFDQGETSANATEVWGRKRVG